MRCKQCGSELPKGEFFCNNCRQLAKGEQVGIDKSTKINQKSMLSIFKKKSTSKSTNADFEEISEKKTTNLGYVLLILMSLFLISISQTIFRDLKRIPDLPPYPSNCVANLKSGSYKTTSYSSTCRFNEIDSRFNLDTQYSAIDSVLINIVNLNNQINQQNSLIRTKQSEIVRKEKEYNLSLQEKLADEETLFDRNTLQSAITQLRSGINIAETTISNLEAKRGQQIKSINAKVAALVLSYNNAQEYYLTANAWYKFKVFGLMLLFVLPFFGISTKLYFRLKRKNSPYTIIFTAVMASSALLFLQVVGVFLYDVILAKWIELIFIFFLSLPFLRYILYYGSVLLVVAIFGGIVYVMQKKIFNPRRVAMRRLKDNKCPNCSFSIDRKEEYCPSCGVQLKEVCEHCSGKRFVHLPHCLVCGKRKGAVTPK